MFCIENQGKKDNNSNDSSLDNIHYYFYTESAGIYEG